MDYRNHPKGMPEHLADILTMLDEMFEHYPWIGPRKDTEKNADWVYTWTVSLGGYESVFVCCRGEFKDWVNHEVPPEEVKRQIWVRVHNALTDIYELHIIP